MEYDSVFKNKTIFTYAIMWMKLQVIIPSERSPTQKEKMALPWEPESERGSPWSERHYMAQPSGALSPGGGDVNPPRQ